MAFGALDGSGTIVAVLIAVALVLLLGYFALNADRPLLWLPVGMLLGGALGNLIDRAREGAVIDFIDPVAWPAFNLADASIVDRRAGAAVRGRGTKGSEGEVPRHGERGCGRATGRRARPPAARRRRAPRRSG